MLRQTPPSITGLNSTPVRHVPPTMSTKVATKRKKESLLDLASKILTETDDQGIFGKYVEMKFSAITNQQQKLYAEKLINDVIFEAMMGSLKPTTRIKDDAQAAMYIQPSMFSQNGFNTFNYPPTTD